MEEEMKNHIFRGFDVAEHPDGRCVISRDGKVVGEQTTIDAAHEWINDQRRHAVKPDPDEAAADHEHERLMNALTTGTMSKLEGSR
jgi:hypothetical protein